MRKIFVLLIVALLMLSLAGCIQPPTPGGDDAQEQPTASPTTDESDTETATDPTDIETSTETEIPTETESDTTEEETTYGPLHFPETDTE